MNAYEEAKAIVDGLTTRDLYKEQKLEKAQVLATLAVAEALEGAGEPAEPWKAPEHIYAVVGRRKDSGEHWQTAVLFVNHSVAKIEMEKQQFAADQANSGYEYSLVPQRLVS